MVQDSTAAGDAAEEELGLQGASADDTEVEHIRQVTNIEIEIA